MNMKSAIDWCKRVGLVSTVISVTVIMVIFGWLVYKVAELEKQLEECRHAEIEEQGDV